MLERPAVVAFDDARNLYITDQSMMRILKINTAQQVEFVLYNNAASAEGFYQCKFIAADTQEFLYAVDDVPSDNGMYIDKERIIRFSPDGEFDRELAVFDYLALPLEDRPMLNGWIRGVQIIDDVFYYLYVGDNELLLCRADESGISMIKSFACNDARKYVLSGAIAPDLQSIYYVTKQGNVIHHTDAAARICYQGFGDNQTLAATSIPSSVTVDRDGNVFISDRGSYSCIRKIAADDVVSVAVRESAEYGPVRSGINANYDRMTLSPDGRYLAATDKYSVVVSTDDTKHIFAKLDKATLSLVHWLYRIGLWSLALLWFVCGAYLIWRALWPLTRRSWSQTTRYVLVILGVSISVCTVVGIIFTAHFYSLMSREMANQIMAITQTAGQTIDGDAVRRIRNLQDYGSEDMEKIRQRMTKLTQNFYKNEANLYYALYQTNGREVYQILARADNIGVMGTMKHFYEGSSYQEVWQSGRPKIFENIKSSSGIWTYGIAPVYAYDGTITGLIEVGLDAKRLLEEQKRMFFVVLGAVLTGIVVLMLCFTEGFYLVKLLRKRFFWGKGISVAKDMRKASLRPLGFIFTLPLYLGSTFLPIYTAKLYQPTFWIPESIGIAIPISAGALAMGVFSYLGGIWQLRFGTKKTLIFSGLATVCGFGICTYAQGFWLFVLGKIIAGSGMGASFVAISTMAAGQGNETEVQQGFADYYASHFAAINVGCVMGGLTATWLGYQEVFLLSSMVALTGVLLVLYFVDNDQTKQPPLQAGAIQKTEMETTSFLRDRGVAAFLFLMYSPYLVAGYFMYYFFPIFANQHGFSEGQIAQIFLLHGLSVVYLGPLITKPLAHFMGNFGAAIFGSLLCIASLGLFVLYPKITGAILVVIVMGIANSFVYTVQEGYYIRLSAVDRFGISRASGIKRVVENIADTAAPFAFGTALLAGVTSGIAIIATSFAAVLALFVAMAQRSRP